MSLHPLVFQPIYKEKVWGGRRLERLRRDLPGGADTPIGESWEVADLTETSASGAGGGAAHSRVAVGQLEGVGLDELMREHRAELLGPVAPTENGGFPLLVKYLDARETLSVQVHPSPAYAAEHPEAHLKSEAWYVVDAEPDSWIYKGVAAGTSREALEAAALDGSLPELLERVPALRGECHYLPSGTCHALGAGVLVAEVQTPSDTTFRLFDWGRTGRELHVATALECVDLGPLDASAFEPVGRSVADGSERRSLVRCPHFAIEEWRTEPLRRLVIDQRIPEIWMVLGGRAHLRSPNDEFDPVVASTGTTVLLPAALPPAFAEVIEPLLMLRITLPEP